VCRAKQAAREPAEAGELEVAAVDVTVARRDAVVARVRDEREAPQARRLVVGEELAEHHRRRVLVRQPLDLVAREAVADLTVRRAVEVQVVPETELDAGLVFSELVELDLGAEERRAEAPGPYRCSAGTAARSTTPC